MVSLAQRLVNVVTLSSSSTPFLVSVSTKVAVLNELRTLAVRGLKPEVPPGKSHTMYN